MKIRTVSQIEKSLDKLWSIAVRLQANNCCIYCGKSEYLNAHHIFGRANKSTRFELGNGVCLCSGHHVFSKIFSAHQTPTEFTYFLESIKGKEFMVLLGKKSREVKQWTIKELLELEIELKETIKRLQNN